VLNCLIIIPGNTLRRDIAIDFSYILDPILSDRLIGQRTERIFTFCLCQPALHLDMLSGREMRQHSRESSAVEVLLRISKE
jgi:hypothetical protein